MSHPTFATRWNADVIEAQYQRWRTDPHAVDPSWRLFFEGFDLVDPGLVTIAEWRPDSRAELTRFGIYGGVGRKV